MTTSPKLLIVSVLGTLAYLGLAILGWGGFAAFFAHPARIALTVVTFALAGAALFTSGNLSSGEREDRGNRWVLAAFGVIGLLAGYLPAYTDRLDFWTIDGDTVRWIGVALFVVGGALRLWPVFVLGNRFSGLVAIQPGHTLVTNGIYGVIRHPSYLGLHRERARLGARVPLRRRRAAHGAHDHPAGGTHERRGGAAALAVRRTVYELHGAHVAAHPRGVLNAAQGLR